MFKKFFVFCLAVQFAYCPVAFAQSLAQIEAGWVRIQGSDGYVRAISPSGYTSLSKGAGQHIWESAVPARGAGGATFTATTDLSIASSKVAVVTKGAVTAAGVFTAAKTILGATAGPVMLTLTALSAADLMIDYFTTANSKLGPLDARETDKPFLKREQVAGVLYTAKLLNDPAYTGTGSTAESAASASASAYAAKNNYVNGSQSYIWKIVLPVSALDTGFQLKRYDNGVYYTGLVSGSITKTDSVSDKWVPASMDDIAPYMEAPDKPVTPEQIEEIAKHAPIPIVYPTEQPSYFPPGVLSIAGPSSIPGTPITSTTETPDKITTTVKTPQTDLKYSSPIDPSTGKPAPTVTAQPGETVTVTETDKATGITKVISTTTTETAPPSSEPVPETPDLCALHPEISACQKLGIAPEAKDLPNTNKPLVIKQEPGWGASSGTCPAPRAMNLHFGTVYLPWDLYCDFANGIRPLVIGLSYLGAAFTFFGLGRKGD